MSRSNTTRRSAIVNALADKFKEIDGSGSFKTRLDNNVETRLKFWDEIEQFPALHITAGSETREYYGGGQKWRFLTITIRAYVNNEDPIEELEKLLEDIETVIDTNNSLTYRQLGTDAGVSQFTVLTIDTDEGVLAPLGIGEMIIEARY
jgi:tetrahydromethanopterin S-methyltransferase subunit G